MKRNIRNCMMGNFHCSTNRIPRGLPRGYSFYFFMKRKILLGVFALALSVTAGFGVRESMKSDVYSNDLVLTNVEVLAQNEDLCPSGCDDNANGCYNGGWYPNCRERFW